MMDCLSLLRKLVLSKGKVSYVDSNGSPVDKIQDAEEFVFEDGVRFPKTEMTLYPNKQSKGFYSLAAVLLLLEHQQKDYSAYLKTSVGAGIISVSFLDKKPLLDYLEGTTDSLPQVKIDSNTRPESNAPVGQALDGDILSVSPTNKRVRDIDPLIAQLYCVEVPKRPRYSSLRVKNVQFTPGLDQMINDKLIKAPTKQPESFLEKNGPPLIIVPLNVSASITKYNVQKFLQGAGYTSTTDLLDAHVVKPGKLIFKRSPIADPSTNQPRYVAPDDLPSEVEVIDTVSDLKMDDWDRVVGVFAIGKEWQFRGFKWENSKDLFNNVPGVYIMNRAEPNFSPELAQGWNVKKYDISSKAPDAYMRFLESFWSDIDNHIRQKKSWYINNTPYWS